MVELVACGLMILAEAFIVCWLTVITWKAERYLYREKKRWRY